MSLFHFHLCAGGRTIEDIEEQDFSDIDGAYARAGVIARQLISDDVREGKLCLARMILVTDDERRPVVRLLFRNAVTITDI